MNKRICCPICRALCCIFNESDTCMKFIPGEAPGYNCPDFLCRKEEKDIDATLNGFLRAAFQEDGENGDIPVVLVGIPK